MLVVLLLGLMPFHVAAAAGERYQLLIPAGDHNFGLESEGLSAFEQAGKWGAINPVGDVVIPFKLNYDWVGAFHNGLAQVRKGAEYGFINTSGKEVVSPKYVQVLDFRDGIALVKEYHEKTFLSAWGAIDTTGKVIIPTKYNFVDVSDNGYNDGYNVNNEGYPFKDGLAAVSIPIIGIEQYDPKTGKFTKTGQEDPNAGKLGYINKKGKVIIPFQYKADYDNKPLFNFNDGLAWVPKGAKYGAINTSGKVVIPFDYDGVEPLNEGLYHVWVEKKDGTFDSKVINSSGKVVFINTYDIIHRFEEEGYASVSKNDKWGFINTAGKVVIPLNYDQVNSFSEGLVQVKKKGKNGFINTSGQEVIPLDTYKNYGRFWGGIAPVYDGSNIGFINMQGDLVVPFEKYRGGQAYESGDDKNHKERYWYVTEGVWGTVYDANGKPDDKKSELINAAGKMIKNIEHYSVGRFNDGFAGFMIKDKNGNRKYGLIKDTAYVPKTAPVKISTTPIASTVLVNGKETAFDAYTINGSNYFKLRDVAQVISGSSKQFEVTWDNRKNAITLVSGKPYTAIGGELALGIGTKQAAALSYSTIYKDGAVVALISYSINNSNYFKLRDLGQAFDFDISWDGTKNTILIDTTVSYTLD
jgi:hypothetical protein